MVKKLAAEKEEMKTLFLFLPKRKPEVKKSAKLLLFLVEASSLKLNGWKRHNHWHLTADVIRINEIQQM